MQTLTVQAIKTEIYRGEDLVEFIVHSVPKDLVKEKMVLAITSKIVSLHEKRLVPKNSVSKIELVKREADIFLGEIGYGCFLTVKEGLVIPSAGIDESNSESGNYILYPEKPYVSAENIWRGLKQRWEIKELGIILTDSHTSPLRRGVTGVALAFWGFSPLRKLVGSKDLFGRELVMTNMNLADGLAATAVMMMGEGSECTPLAVLTGAEIDFCEATSPEEIIMPFEDDLYAPLLKGTMKPRPQD